MIVTGLQTCPVIFASKAKIAHGKIAIELWAARQSILNNTMTASSPA